MAGGDGHQLFGDSVHGLSAALAVDHIETGESRFELLGPIQLKGAARPISL